MSGNRTQRPRTALQLILSNSFQKKGYTKSHEWVDLSDDNLGTW